MRDYLRILCIAASERALRTRRTSLYASLAVLVLPGTASKCAGSMNGQRERGAVALATTIVISILLTIITTGLITLMVSELRQSNDAEQSVRAYYAAQSGVEDGARKVINDLATNSKLPRYCGTAGSQNTNLDPAVPGAVGWTCQQITYSGSPTGSLPTPDKAVQVDVGDTSGNAPHFQSMRLEWDLSVGAATSFFNAPAANFPPTASGWPYAAAVEMAIIDYQAGSFSASTPGTISLRNVLTVPSTTGTGTVDYAAIRGSNAVQGRCVPAAVSYHCSLVVRSMPSSGGRGYIFRLRSKYVGTDYRLTFYTSNNGVGAVVNVPDGTATIDITAKAGDAFRRVIYKMPYRAGAATGLDYVIYSGGDICKNFAIINSSLQPGTIGCPYN